MASLEMDCNFFFSFVACVLKSLLKTGYRFFFFKNSLDLFFLSQTVLELNLSVLSQTVLELNLSTV